MNLSDLLDLLHPTSVAGPLLVAYGVARLWVRRGWLFRRSGGPVPVDLPAYAGWGPTGIPPAPEPRPDLGRYERAMDQHRQHWPEEARICDCTGAPHRMEPPCPDYLRLMSGMGKREWEDFRDALEKPAPAENARRYSEEGGTW